MWTLIRRELEDFFAYLLLTLALVVLCIIIQAAFFMSGKSFDDKNFYQGAFFIITFVFFIIAFPLIFFFLGADQIGRDRTRKISAFLCTLATTRNRIFAAKLIAGAAQLLIVFIPMTVMSAMMLGSIDEPAVQISTFWHRLLASLFLLNVAAYSLGMMVGERATVPILYVGFGLVAVAILDGLVFIKSPGLFSAVMLLVLIVGAVSESRRRFLTKPL
jgi:ABC-type transport system involved in multi-copper enzyme maturation permease subunit